MSWNTDTRTRQGPGVTEEQGGKTPALGHLVEPSHSASPQAPDLVVTSLRQARVKKSKYDKTQLHCFKMGFSGWGKEVHR